MESGNFRSEEICGVRAVVGREIAFSGSSALRDQHVNEKSQSLLITAVHVYCKLMRGHCCNAASGKLPEGLQPY